MQKENSRQKRLLAVVPEQGDAGDDFAQGVAVDHVVSVGDMFTGYLLGSDFDVVEVPLSAGTTYEISVGPRFRSWADVQDTFLFIVNEAGETVAFNDDIDFWGGNYYSRVSFEACYSGAYRVVATTHETYYGQAAEDFGGYTITIREETMPTNWTHDQIANYLTYGGWGDVSYSWNVSPGNSITYDVTGLTETGKTLARTALLAWENVLGVGFTEVTSGGEIVFDDNQAGAWAQFSTWNGYIESANVNISTNWLSSYGTDIDDYSFQTYLHEIGHALGLAHAGDYDGGATYGVHNLYLNDSWQQTIMSYFDQDDNTSVNASFAYVITPQIADILAVQALYGVAGNIRTGDTTYGANSNAGGYYDQFATLSNVSFTILDDGGTDTLDTSTYGGWQNVDLEPESYSSIFGETGNLGIARGTVLENYEGGSGTDIVFGNDAGNRINGNDGNDSIYGRDGNDVLNGGAGADRLVGNDGDDTLNGGSGNDILKGIGGNNTMDGGDDDDRLIGSDTGDDAMIGGAGSDILAGLSGADTLDGGDGDDFLYGGRDNDILTGGAGEDVLRGNLNNDDLDGGAATDCLYGGGGNDTLFGGDGRDYLLGENGSDTLDGGTGDDNMTGGAGVDTFVYRDQNYGYDRILDFEDGTDLIDLTDFGLSGMVDINSIASDVTAGVRINFGFGNVLLIESITESLLDSGDFIF